MHQRVLVVVGVCSVPERIVATYPVSDAHHDPAPPEPSVAEGALFWQNVGTGT